MLIINWVGLSRSAMFSSSVRLRTQWECARLSQVFTVEEYMLLSTVLHVVVSLKRTGISRSRPSGKLNMVFLS